MHACVCVCVCKVMNVCTCVCVWMGAGGWEEGESVEGEGSDPPIIQLGSHVRSCVGVVHAWIDLEALA